jgi:hypothetical protein
VDEDDTTVALSQSTRTCPVFSFVVLVRTPTTVPGLRSAEAAGVARLADPAEEGTDRRGGGARGGGEAATQREEARGRDCGDASVPVESREWETVDGGISWCGGRWRGSRTASLEP